MNELMLALKYGPILIQGFQLLSGVVTEMTSNDDAATKISKVTASAPSLGSFISQVGSELFPHSSSTLQQVGAVIASFSPNYVVWVQQSCNQLLAGVPGYVPLKPDGHYGDLTKAAVAQLQAKLGIKADSLAGNVTKLAISAALQATSK